MFEKPVEYVGVNAAGRRIRMRELESAKKQTRNSGAGNQNRKTKLSEFRERAVRKFKIEKLTTLVSYALSFPEFRCDTTDNRIPKKPLSTSHETQNNENS